MKECSNCEFKNLNCMKNEKEVVFNKIYSAPREYLTGDEENELQLIRERLKEKYKEEYLNK